MPTYVYETIPSKPNQQPRRFEVEQRMSAAALTHDPETGLSVRRVISGGLGFIGASDKASDPALAAWERAACRRPRANCPAWDMRAIRGVSTDESGSPEVRGPEIEDRVFY